jgi:hypothetical protein
VSNDPIGGLIVIARNKVLKGQATYTAYAKECTCHVEVSALNPPTTSPMTKQVMQSTREHYSRCTLHPVR